MAARGSQADRLDLAEWLVREDHPLVPRVAANHIWWNLFGAGIVRTPGDFGVRGQRPTHPELLDWLAAELIARGWSRKEMIRLIVSSATYRQSSAMPLPPGIAELSYANNFKWNPSTGEDRYRRGMYTFFKRTAPHPNLTTFDCPDSNTTCLVRQTSNTPLQALVTLNNENFVEAAQALARRLIEASPNDNDRLTLGMRLCVARPPSGEERTAFAELLATSRQWYAAHEADAKTAVGAFQPAGAAPTEAAAWVATARIMLNLDEFLTRE
jgi:hypothetical protein